MEVRERESVCGSIHVRVCVCLYVYVYIKEKHHVPIRIIE